MLFAKLELEVRLVSSQLGSPPVLTQFQTDLDDHEGISQAILRLEKNLAG